MAPEKRKLSTRNRGEPPLKKRQSSPPPPPPPPPQRPKTPVEEGLPVKLKDGQPLPTLPERQNADLSVMEFQSIAESGVLAAAIERSRQKWLTEGVFEKYWAKPSKKKAQTDISNPAKESMAKLGVCSMIIEPHVFDITLYTVKESLPTFSTASVQPPLPPSSEFNPFQNHSTYQTPLYHVRSSPAPHYSRHSLPNPNPSQLTLPPFKEGFGQFGPQGPGPLHHPPVAAPKPVMPERQGPPTSGPRQDENSNSGAKPSPDPVIQMLATRAASDHNLKALMKVVASGNASQKQLRDFQNHIDDLNGILKSRDPPSQPMQDQNTPKPPPSSTADYKTQNLISTSTLGMAQPPHHPPPISHPIPPPPIKPEPHPQYFSHIAPPLKSKAPAPYKSDISAIAFDFGTGDRFLFPRFSILEYLPGGTQVLVSFLIIRKGSMAASGSYNNNASYYQPVTMRLSTPHPKTLEPLARVVAPADEVRSYMNSVFDKMKVAEKVFLATRLPKPVEDDEVENVGAAMEAIQPIVRTTYSPPNSLVPLRA